MNRALIDNNALSNLIKNNITEDIIMGKILPGEKLIETKYAEEFGTSRAPIREAFYLLSLEGFVEKIPRKGTVVRGYSAEEIKDLLMIRCYLENLAIEKLEHQDISQDLVKMEQLLTAMEAKGSEKEYAKLNYDFHSQLVTASRSDVLENMYAKLGVPLLSVQTIAFMEGQNMEQSLAEHKQIVHLLREKNFAEAKQLLDTHNKAVFPRIEKYLEKKGSGAK
ncbi:GntR family transcriptional regulator [Brevibacillus fluminis]|uniref:GntR family transcriptional regulator n=1 Tax=Brevibacillus fluminis TaxID=511487 RepID=A0A3M8DNX1_9BACL|nr:GntR family transcriptional regulator [Brevibacillus fluminis]RNB89802.1 GntR family transcriptional regulator [Brevibacillus fluminis]